MPRRVLQKLEKVVSTKILASQFEELLEYARNYYLKKIIPQPTISEFLRYIISHYLVGGQSSLAAQRIISQVVGESIQKYPYDTPKMSPKNDAHEDQGTG